MAEENTEHFRPIMLACVDVIPSGAKANDCTQNQCTEKGAGAPGEISHRAGRNCPPFQPGEPRDNVL